MDSQLRHKIINEAYKMFMLRGIKGTSLNDIIKSVNKSKGALTYYFPSKDDLVRTVIDTCFFPDSQIPVEWDELSKKGYRLFLRVYRNPIERVIHNFSFSVKSNKLMAYMQFVASANEYVDDFAVNYHKLLEEENRFLEQLILNAIEKGELSIEEAREHQNHFFKMSIGHTFSSYLI